MRRIQFGSKLRAANEAQQQQLQKENKSNNNNDDGKREKVRLFILKQNAEAERIAKSSFKNSSRADSTGSEMGKICLWQNKGPTIYDAIGSHDFAEKLIAAALIELLQTLIIVLFLFPLLKGEHLRLNVFHMKNNILVTFNRIFNQDLFE